MRRWATGTDLLREQGDDRQGFAVEASVALLGHVFPAFPVERVQAHYLAGNAASRRVMEKLGMTHSPHDDFDHPELPEGHPIRNHVLYRLKNPS